MKKLTVIACYCMIVFCHAGCKNSGNTQNKSSDHESDADPGLIRFINSIRAVDNHAHPNTVDPVDNGSDALPLDGLGAIELPARVRAHSRVWVNAAKALYGFRDSVLQEKDFDFLAVAAENLKKQQGEKFPEWVLDKAGIEVMLANRIGMGHGITAPRFRWVSYVDALLYPLSTKGEADVSPDRARLFPLNDAHLGEFLTDLHLVRLPGTFDGYLKQVVTAVLEMQKKGDCLAIKFEIAYLRSFDFANVSEEAASAVYARYVRGGKPSATEYKTLQDFLFYYIAKEAGRLGMAVHIHSFTGVGNYFVAAGCDPLLLEPVFNDSALRHTTFVIIHGGGLFSRHTGAMLWKPNVYCDISLLTQVWPPEQLAAVLKEWLAEFPEKVLFGTDAVAFGPGLGWDMSAWNAATTGRRALAIALSAMVKSSEISYNRAKQIAIMVMRSNANSLYHLNLP